jgi:myo-inositol-1(or 4)-monophosphatase
MSSTLKIIENTILKAGKILSRDFGEIENLQVSKKGPGNFVTSSDLKVERILIEEFQKTLPQHSIMSEERGYIAGTSDKYTFIIDPIDGTSNFMRGIPYFCISVGLQEKLANGKKQIVAAGIYAPALNELYLAEKGEGATVNGRRLVVSNRDNFEDASFACYISKFNPQRRAQDLDSLNKFITNIRILGSAAMELAFVSAGKLDGMWHCNLKPWDIAAGVLLVTEARGIVTEIDGNSNFLETGSILASNSAVNDKLRKVIAPCYK